MGRWSATNSSSSYIHRRNAFLFPQNLSDNHKMALSQAAGNSTNASFKDKEKPMAVRAANILAARALSDAVRTSLGPRGMDKMIQDGRGQTIITNDGNTMLKSMAVMHPSAKMLVDLSAAQDVEAGDGTTSVVVICGSLLGAADRLLGKGIHPSVIAESFQRAAAAAVQVLHDMSHPVALTDPTTLLQAATTSLSSKIVSQHSNILAPMAVNAVTKTIDIKTADNVDLRNIRILKKVGGTIEDTEMVEGLVLDQPVLKSGGGPVRMEKARIGLIQFQLSPPKPDMENQIVVNDYRQMDKILKEERTYLLNMVKKIKKAKCNVLFIQKSILRDAVNDLSLHFLAKQSRALKGTEAICWKAFADAMEVIPTTLAENAGLNSIKVVTELRYKHENGEKNAGVSIKSGGVKIDIADENVLQPLLVSTSAVELAAETVKMILRID